MERRKPFCRKIAICILILALGTVAQAQYAGGSGTPDDPYLITTPEQMNAIGAKPNDWDKHFKLMADIDLSQYTGTEFNLIGYSWGIRNQLPFTGIFDGNGHTISNFTYTGEGDSYIGLFRSIEAPNAGIRNLGLVAPKVDGGSRDDVGALVGHLEYGTITNCHIEGGTVAGHQHVGGLVGAISGWRRGRSGPVEVMVRGCYCTCDVAGTSYVGGLVGDARGAVRDCYATGVVTGNDHVGGLAGNGVAMVGCYADGIVRGSRYVGGLVGGAGGITNCYARGIVIGNEHVGGLAGDAGSVVNCYAAAYVQGVSHTGGLVGPEWLHWGVDEHVVGSFWDMETSMQMSSGGGTGRSTAEMQALATFLSWGQGEHTRVWTIDDGNDYPRLAWEHQPGTAIGPLEFPALFPGTGTQDDPYLIYSTAQLDLIGQHPEQWDKHYKLMADIDLASYSDSEFHLIGSWEIPFQGTFNGNGHTISNFTHVSEHRHYVALFAYVQLDPCIGRRYCDPAQSAVITNLGLVDPNVRGGTECYLGSLVGYLASGTVTNCYVEGGTVSSPMGSQHPTGGLVGYCGRSATVAACHASAVVIGGESVGGSVGYCDHAMIKNCYATGTVIGDYIVGGLIGYGEPGALMNCYATGVVVGDDAGGLVGRWYSKGGPVGSFWDVQISGRDTGRGIGLTTAQMQTAVTFLEAGWDFVGEAENGTEDVWWIDEGRDYPRLWWERKF